MDLLLDAIDAIDINRGGVDAPELVAEGVEQQQVEHLSCLSRLSKSIAFLDGKLEGVPVC